MRKGEAEITKFYCLDLLFLKLKIYVEYNALCAKVGLPGVYSALGNIYAFDKHYHRLLLFKIWSSIQSLKNYLKPKIGKFNCLRLCVLLLTSTHFSLLPDGISTLFTTKIVCNGMTHLHLYYHCLV